MISDTVYIPDGHRRGTAGTAISENCHNVARAGQFYLVREHQRLSRPEGMAYDMDN